MSQGAEMVGEIDSQEIEGTPERAADPGRSFLDFPDFDGSSHLGNRDVVDGIARAFIRPVVDARSTFHLEKIPGDEAHKLTFDAIKDTALIFNGKDANYETMPQ